MKILFATYPMAFHTPGGGEIQLLQYKKHLVRHGLQVDLLDLWKPDFMRYDLVHFFSCIGGSSHFCGFIKQLGLPLVVSSSLWVTEETKHLYPCDEITTQFNYADCVVTNADLEGDALSQVLKVPREKFKTVYNGVDEIFLQTQPADLFRSHVKLSEAFVLNVGNIEPRKNQLALVRAMKAFPEYKLVLIGHQRDQAYAAQCIKEGGEQVVYAGALAHDDPLLRSAYAGCEAFCLPSTLETPGLAALEAYASGCQVVVTEVGSTKEYFNDEALYLNPLDQASIQHALSQAFEQKSAAIKKRDNQAFMWHEVTKPLIEVYQSLLV